MTASVTRPDAPASSTLPGIDPLIRIAHVSKRYAMRQTGCLQALDDINLDIWPGEFVAIVGPSGCGKTTLLHILAGLLGDFEGSVTLAGARVDGPSPHVGVVFLDATLLPWLTVLQNVLIPAKLQHRDTAPIRQKAADLLKLVGLEGFERSYPGELSGGMQQRAGICRALVGDPAVLLMDEPFAALDAITRDGMNAELQRIWQRSASTAVLVTHAIPEAVFLADRVAVMSPHPGKVAGIVDVNLPRPRTVDDMGSPQAIAAVAQIRALLGGVLDKSTLDRNGRE